MRALFTRFLHEDKGQDLIEYALLGGFVSLAAIVGAQALGTALDTWYGDVATTVEGVTPGGA